MKRLIVLVAIGAIAILTVTLSATPSNNTPVATPTVIQHPRSPSPTVQPTTVGITAVPTKTTPTPVPAASSAPTATPAPTPTPAPTNDPKCFPRLSIDPYLTNLVSDMQAAGYSQAQIDQVIAQTHWVIIWQADHCQY